MVHVQRHMLARLAAPMTQFSGGQGGGRNAGLRRSRYCKRRR